MTPSEVGEELYELGYRHAGDDGEGNHSVRGPDGKLESLDVVYFRVIAKLAVSRMQWREKMDRIRKGAK